MSKLLKSKVNP